MALCYNIIMACNRYGFRCDILKVSQLQKNFEIYGYRVASYLTRILKDKPKTTQQMN